MTRAHFDSTTALSWAARLWYLVTAFGMWLFVYYIVAFFYAPTLRGEFESWNANRFLDHGHVPGDTAGNLMFAAHVLLAAVVTLGGTIQLVPQIRQRALALHRWNGRVFMVAALLTTIAGLGMNLVRFDWDSGAWRTAAIDVSGVLILIFAALAWTYARRGEIAAHRRWALRTFMVVSGVWFLRLGVSIWILSSAALYGNPKFVSEFFKYWAWGCYLVPLVVLELYLRAQARGTAVIRNVVAGLLVVLSFATAAGVFGAHQVFWGPLL